MKRFAFRLQPLLDIKKRREEDLKLELARKNAGVLSARGRAAENRKALSDFQDAEKLRRTASVSAQSLRLSIAFRYRLQRDIAQAEAVVESLSREAAVLLHSLTEAKRESKTLEILRDKKRSQWKLDYKREEQEIIDDVSQKKYIRQKNASAALASA